MGAIASQITSPTIVYSTVYSDADQRKHHRSASLAFVWGIHRGLLFSCTNGQSRGKCFHLMTSSRVTRPTKMEKDTEIRHWTHKVIACPHGRVMGRIHYSDVIMSAMAYQIAGVSIVCSTVFFRRRSSKPSKLRVTGLCEGNPPVTGGFPSLRASNAEMFLFGDVIMISWVIWETNNKTLLGSIMPLYPGQYLVLCK